VLDVSRRVRLEGTVRIEGGLTLANAWVGLRSGDRRSNLQFGARTDAKGRYRLDLPDGMTWTLTAAHDLHPSLVLTDLAIRAPARMPLDLVLPRERSVRGRVVDRSGRPVGGAQVHTRLPSWRNSDYERVVTTAPDGSFQFCGIDAGALEVVLGCRSDDRGFQWQQFPLGADAPPIELVFERP